VIPGRRSRLALALALALCLAWVGVSRAAVVGVPQFTLSPFTKRAENFTSVRIGLTWLPPSFIPPTPQDKQVVAWTDLDTGASFSNVRPPGGSSWPVSVVNGHRYSFTVLACQEETCPAGSPQTTGATRIDATPPSGAMQINAGAAATNDRRVTLDFAATDPLIDGVPETSSGITQAAVDVDGDGTMPCNLFGDTSGCAASFAPTVPATLPAGDGLKRVGVVFGDGARAPTRPCPTVFCVPDLLPGTIAGNASAPAVDTILLDTVRPLAIATQDRFTVARGGAVRFDATTSLDPGGAVASGIDPAATTWAFKDGTPVATGARASHAFDRVGTFVGELRVRDRAGNLSDARAFSVTVDPGPGAAAPGGRLGAVGGTAAFRIDRLRVRARYVRSRLVGSIALAGSSDEAGALRVELRRRARGRPLATRAPRRLDVGPFARTVTLPARLAPGAYRVAFLGPGGALRTRLTLRAPREGVIGSARVSASGGRATALFRMAAQPARALRGRLTVSWLQGRRRLGSVAVSAGPLIRAGLPAGASHSGGRLRAELRAGGIVVGSAAARPR
jgi:hypothetical protein